MGKFTYQLQEARNARHERCILAFINARQPMQRLVLAGKIVEMHKLVRISSFRQNIVKYHGFEMILGENYRHKKVILQYII